MLPGGRRAEPRTASVTARRVQLSVWWVTNLLQRCPLVLNSFRSAAGDPSILLLPYVDALASAGIFGFPMGLTLCVVAGADLFTSNCM